MNRFIRYYNQNRKGIWMAIIVVIFVIVIIQVLNSFYAAKSEEERKNNSNNVNKLNSSNKVEKQSEAIVQGEITSNAVKTEYARIMDKFLDYCCNGKPEEAYQLLSNNCKQKLYPTEKAFETGYYNTKFNQKKTYDFQLWSAVNKTYIYLVKIYDDMLSSGIAATQNYIQDYYSVIQEDNVYRLSISSYIKNTSYQTTKNDETGDDAETNIDSQEDNISILVTDRDSYMDYEIYHVLVVNNSDNNILLDSTADEENVVVLDENGNEFNAMLMELNQDDMFVEKGSSKYIDIKFARSYISDIEVVKMKFKKVIKNYEQFVQDENAYKDFVEIKIDLK